MDSKWHTNRNVSIWGRKLCQTLIPVALLLTAMWGFAQDPNRGPLGGNERVQPFKIIGNVYYVGMSDVTSYLITTPEGHILLDSTYASTVPVIRESIEKLGFKMRDIKILLNSHGHNDHQGGHALMKELTGAQILMSDADADSLAESRPDRGPTWKPAKADKVFRDGEQVRLGGVTMGAHLTPGHTKGCTTWATTVEENGKRSNVVFVCGVRLGDGAVLVGNRQYPAIADDYVKSFQRLKELPCDIFLAPHGSFFGLTEKIKRMEQGTGTNPFIDPQGYRAYIETSERAFREALEKQRAAR